MTLIGLLDAALGRCPRPVRPPCRLTEEQALNIAAAALDGTTSLVVHDVVTIGERTEWRVGTATVGSGRIVQIDDATGDVVAIRRWGVR